ncbi:TonB-dependent receptor [Gammaproteobacteria bacterium]|jgi:outer membrane receptor protein involved in Fe transport|nr:TonB-dependent receptor [Gammaproteobacteria bacterium]
MIDLKKYLFSAFAVISLSVPLAIAQDSEEDVEEVIVTGSRIVDPNIISSSQIAVIDGQDIIDAGVTRVEDYLNDMPQISPGQSITNSNGSNGTATVNLRNLGCSRTLVLMNGRRLVPGTTGGGSCADLNTIPTLLLKKVEVLTGGASSVYGSDAVAGVVNFVLDDEFEGFKAAYSHGFYNHKNDISSLRELQRSYGYENAPKDVQTGDTGKFSIAFGGDINDGKGHVTAFYEHTDTKPMLQGEFDISACALSGGIGRCGGSSTIPPGRWADFSGYKNGGFVNVDPTVTGVDWKVQGNDFVNRDGQTYNYNPTNFFQRPDDRMNMGFFGKYEITDNAEVYLDFTAMKSESNAQIAYSGTFGNIESLPCYNALLSAQQYQVACADWTGMGGSHAPDFATGAAALAYINGLNTAVADGTILGYSAPLTSLKRNVEGNPRQSITTYKSYNTTLGIKGDINDDWSYDIYYQNSAVNYGNEYRNDLSVIAINRAVNVISVAGVPTCVSKLQGIDANCVPYNLFQGGLPGDAGIQGVIDSGQTAQDYLAKSTFINGDGKQKILSGYVTGDTGFTLPGAPGSVSLVAGFETKELSTDFRPDTPTLMGDRSGSGGATLPIGGKYDVDEFFLELGIPVMDNLSVEVGYRTADYSTGNDTDSTKLGAYWTVNDTVSLRASFQTAQRHANIEELYLAVSDGLVDLDNDPCSIQQNGDPATATQAQCALTGLAANLYNTDLNSPADQYNTKGGGNPNVSPEESESLTIGAVITPESIPGLTLTVDYFDITVEDGIGSVSAKTALDKCVSTGQAQFCNLINRRPDNGSLWLTGGYISAQLTNIGEETTSGFDFIFDYSMDTQYGELALEGVTTMLDTADIIELPGSQAISCAGNWGGSCGKNPMPELSGKYKATLMTEYNADISLGMRYLGETDDLNSNKIDFDAMTYWDVTLQYSATDNLMVTFGINNLLDEDPGYTSDAGTAPGNGNTFPGYFDAFGQYIFLNMTLSY